MSTMDASHDEAYLAEWRQRAKVDAQDRDAYCPGGHGQPDQWDVKARAVIEYRDRIADSVTGAVPEIGTPEWAAADWRTQTAAYARHERDVAAARGKEISNRMAAEAGDRRDRVESSQAMSAEYTLRGYAAVHLPFSELQRRRAEVVIPLQRTAETVARAREACQAAERQESAVAEEPPAAGAALERGR